MEYSEASIGKVPPVAVLFNAQSPFTITQALPVAPEGGVKPSRRRSNRLATGTTSFITRNAELQIIWMTSFFPQASA